MKKITAAAALAANLVLQPALSFAHGTSGEPAGKGISRVLDAFTHWPPNAADAHYYFEAIFLLSFLVLLSVQLIQNARKKKKGHSQG